MVELIELVRKKEAALDKAGVAYIYVEPQTMICFMMCVGSVKCLIYSCKCYTNLGCTKFTGHHQSVIYVKDANGYQI